MGFVILDGTLASPGEHIGCTDTAHGSAVSLEAWARDNTVRGWDEMGFVFNMCVAGCISHPAMRVEIYRILHHGRVYVRAKC